MDEKDHKIFSLQLEIAQLYRFKDKAVSKYPDLEEDFKKTQEEYSDFMKKFCICLCCLLVLLAFFLLWANTK